MKIEALLLTGFFLTQVSFSPAIAQTGIPFADGEIAESVLNENIKSIQLYREGWPLSYPVARLTQDVPLVLQFDDLSGEGYDMSYNIIHCDADWKPSELTEQEYLDGFPDNDLPAGIPSFHTYTSYLHYEMHIPNRDIQLTKSGNYVLVVYRNRDREDVLFTRRFLLTEGLATIEARAGIPALQRLKACCQQVDFTVEPGRIQTLDPSSESTAYVYQNGVWDFTSGPLRPSMVLPDKLEYRYHEETVFPGGNEFRFFDTKNTRTPTYYVQEIRYLPPYFHFELKPDKANPAHVYRSGEDINGRYAVEAENSQDAGVDADYVLVHFSLNLAYPPAGDIFIAGALTDWQIGDFNRMEYDADSDTYRQSLLLKQGVYNYRYLFLPEEQNRFDVSEIEGSFSETENEYLILFYYREPGTYYDRLLGHQVIHSGGY